MNLISSEQKIKIKCLVHIFKLQLSIIAWDFIRRTN